MKAIDLIQLIRDTCKNDDDDEIFIGNTEPDIMITKFNTPSNPFDIDSVEIPVDKCYKIW